MSHIIVNKLNNLMAHCILTCARFKVLPKWTMTKLIGDTSQCRKSWNVAIGIGQLQLHRIQFTIQAWKMSTTTKWARYRAIVMCSWTKWNSIETHAHSNVMRRRKKRPSQQMKWVKWVAARLWILESLSFASAKQTDASIHMYKWINEFMLLNNVNTSIN